MALHFQLVDVDYTSPTLAGVSVTVNSSIPLGPKNIAVNRRTDAAVISGAIVVVDPQPSGIVVQPSVGSVAGQTRVMITGNNFRNGAKIYFAAWRRQTFISSIRALFDAFVTHPQFRGSSMYR